MVRLPEAGSRGRGQLGIRGQSQAARVPHFSGGPAYVAREMPGCSSSGGAPRPLRLPLPPRATPARSAAAGARHLLPGGLRLRPHAPRTSRSGLPLEVAWRGLAAGYRRPCLGAGADADEAAAGVAAVAAFTCDVLIWYTDVLA